MIFGGACAGDRVDPGYMSLVEQQKKESRPSAGSMGPGDEFRIDVYGEEGLSGEYTVSSDGTINYPHIGRITVAGRTCGELERELSEGLANGYLRNPSVSCSLTEYNSKRVFIFGEVNNPGSYAYDRDLTIVDGLALAGGLTERANSNNTKLTREINGSEVQVRVPMQEVVEGRRENLELLPGDILYVPQSPY